MKSTENTEITSWDSPFPRIVWFGRARTDGAARLSELLPQHGISNTEPVEPTLQLVETVLRMWDEVIPPGPEPGDELYLASVDLAPLVYRLLMEETGGKPFVLDTEGVIDIVYLLDSTEAYLKYCEILGIEPWPSDEDVTPGPCPIDLDDKDDPTRYSTALRRARVCMDRGLIDKAVGYVSEALELIELITCAPRDGPDTWINYVDVGRRFTTHVPIDGVAHYVDDLVELAKRIGEGIQTPEFTDRILAVKRDVVAHASTRSCKPD